MPTKLKVLILEDSAADAELVVHELRRAGFDPEWKRVETEPEYLAQLDQGWEIILADYDLPEFNGLRALQLLRGRDPDLPFILISGTIGEGKAVEIMKAGASNYVMKDQLARLGPAVERESHDAVERRKRKQVDEELRASGERFRQLVENIREVYWIRDRLARRILYISPAYETIWGRTTEEVYRNGLSFMENVHPEDKERISVSHGALYDECRPFDEEYRVIRPDGLVRWVRARTYPVFDQNGKVTRDVGIAEDITDRKQAEGNLVKSERQFRQLSELLPQIVFETDLKGNLTFSNLFGIKSFGYSLEDFKSGVNIFALIAPEDREAIKTRFKEIVSGSETAVREYQVMRKDGGKFPILMHANVILEDGVPIGLRGIAIDITERKKSEEKLVKTLESLRKALGGIIQVLSAMTEKRDPYTAGHQRRVADLARAIGQKMGLAAERVEGLRLAGTIHDIGKISVPAEILSKPTRLTEIEYKLIQTHAQVGYDILQNVDFSWPIAQMVLQHHERMNGSGYPNRLKGEEILLEARILAVSDVVEAMSSHRPYRPALGIEVALEEIEKNKGVLYDPDVVSACLTLFREKRFEFK